MSGDICYGHRVSQIRTCEICGSEFTARRSDATTCSARCRQKKHRSYDPITDTPKLSGIKDGTRKRSALADVNRIIQSDGERTRALSMTLEMLDVLAAVESPAARLAEWDAELTASIRLRTRLRRVIRDAQMESQNSNRAGGVGSAPAHGTRGTASHAR